MVTAISKMPNLLSFLYPNKGQRVCDVGVYLPNFSLPEIKVELERLVTQGEAEKYEHNGEAMYFLVRKAA